MANERRADQACQCGRHVLHALVRAGELCIGDLADTVGMKPQAVSNQLQRLVAHGILGAC